MRLALLLVFVISGLGGFANAQDASAGAFPIATDRAPTLAALRRRFRGARVWRRTTFGENDPDFPIRSFCVDRGARCGLEFFLTANGESLHGLIVRTPSFVGPAGIRVGASHASLASVLESDCIISLGDDVGLFCDVVGYPNVRVAFTTPGLDGDVSGLSETPTEAQLAAARVVSFFWSADPN